MGQLTQFFQPPLYWQQFEDLTQALVQEVYSLPHADKVGRPGQAQKGVDVYAFSPRDGHIGVQCKRLADLDENNQPYPGGAITPALLRSEATEALSFAPSLRLWILATTAKRDAGIQEFARDLSQEFDRKGAFRIIIWAWDDYVSWLNALPRVQLWYYDQVIQLRGPLEQDRLILQTIASAFDRPAFTDPLDSEHVDDFIQALRDTQLALRTGELVDRQSRHVIRKALGGWRLLESTDWKSALEELNQELQDLRTKLVQGVKDGRLRKRSGYMDVIDRALGTDLEARRRKCVRLLNATLINAGIPTV